MSKKDRELALQRLEIVNAKRADTFMNRDVVFVTWDEEKQEEKLIYLPYMRYFVFICKYM